MVTAGSRLGIYEVVGPLGAGGMGEVYRARDTKLGRDVALKILPAAFTTDPERVARFAREAQALAVLNHPHIAAIHAVEDSSGTHALVMELIEGDTLAERIARGAIPLDESLHIASQVADALRAAHEHGIVHRDLKPANIKITPDGRVKVLDFGLAKLDPAASGADVDLSPTISLNATHAGVILGTAAYMAPEQARGKSVDKRADIWAFGVILYEMLVGRRLFAGASLTDTVAAVIEREVNLTAIPDQVRPLLHACLQKDPRRRLQDIGDAAVVLESAAGSVQHRAQPSKRTRIAWIAAAGVFAVTAVALGVVHFREQVPSPPEPVRFQISTPTLVSGTDFYMAVSPDGRRLAYTAVGADGLSHIWIRAMQTLESRMIAGTERARSLSWSPDSRFVLFGQETRLRKVDASGAVPPVTLCEMQAQVGMSAWNRDDVVLFASRSTGTGLWRVPAAGGTPVVVTRTTRDQVAHTFPAFLPDGRHFIYLVRSSKAEAIGIYGGSLDLPPEQQPTTRIVASQFGAAYVEPRDRGIGHLLFVRDGTLLTQPFDVKQSALTGEPVPVVEQVGTAGSSAFFGVSSAVLAYRSGGGARRQLAWFDRKGALIDSGAGRQAAYTDIALSPDGKRIAVYENDGQMDVWVMDIARNAKTRLTFDASVQRLPVWSPDGMQIAYASATTANGPFAIYRTQADGGGQPELLLQSNNQIAPMDWSPDGRYLAIVANEDKGTADLLIVPLAGDRKPIPFLTTAFNEIQAHFSPDGRWIVYRSNQTGTDEVYVRPFAPPGEPQPSGQWMISNGGGWQPRWRADGKEILYISPANMLMSVDVTEAGKTFQANAPKPLFAVPIYGGAQSSAAGSRWDMSRDGQRILVTEAPADTTTAPITIVENWQSSPNP